MRDRLPRDWLLRREPPPRDSRFDALLTIGASEEQSAPLLVEAKRRVGPRDIQGLVRSGSDAGVDDDRLLVSGYFSPRTRELLESAGINYVDGTGNVCLSLREPAVFIRTAGADTDPAPVPSKLRSLKGPAASRVVRAVLDFRAPYRISALAERAGSPLATVHRVIELLDAERLLERTPRGPVTAVDWEGVLQRWTSGYGPFESNRVRRT